MSANNVVWIMNHITWDGLWHVFYSGCMDNTPEKPDYKAKYYKVFQSRTAAIMYAHDVVDEINEEAGEGWGVSVEYGVCIVPDKGIKQRLSNIVQHINKLNKESIETNIIIKKTLGSWLDKNGERIVKEYVKRFNPSLFMEMKFKENEDKIKKLEDRFICKRDHYDMDKIADHVTKGDHDELRPSNYELTKENLLESFKEHFPDCNNIAWDIIKEAIKEATTRKPAKRKDNCNRYNPNATDCRNNLCKSCIPPTDSKPVRDCDKCDYYGQCDHQGAYQRDGKWCYE